MLRRSPLGGTSAPPGSEWGRGRAQGARFRHLCSSAQSRGGRRLGAPEPARARGGRTCPEPGGGGHLSLCVRGADARTREAHLLAGARGPARPPPRESDPQVQGRGGQCNLKALAWRRRRTRCTMAELLRSLQDSQLVARFQRRCGLFPAPDEGPHENGAGPAEGAVRAPEVGHHPEANGKGGWGPANGLRRAPAPQVTARQVFARVEGSEGAALPAACGLAGPGDSATPGLESAEPARPRGRHPRQRPGSRSCVWRGDGGPGESSH